MESRLHPLHPTVTGSPISLPTSVASHWAFQLHALFSVPWQISERGVSSSGSPGLLYKSCTSLVQKEIAGGFPSMSQQSNGIMEIRTRGPLSRLSVLFA